MPTPYADLSGGPYYDLVLRHYPKNRVLLDLATMAKTAGRHLLRQRPLPARRSAQIRDLYDGSLVYTDDNLGRILRALDELGLGETTAVVATGDHGEALGDHDLYFTHDFTLYDEVLRVPLVIRMPRTIQPATVIDQQVRLMDIAPTLLELVDLEPSSDMQMEGVSLRPLLEGRTLSYLPAFAESAPYRHQFPQQKRVFYKGNKGKWRMVRNERWKLILIPNPEGDIFELYDLESDPLETKNLYAELPGEAAKLWPLLQAWLQTDPERDADPSAEDERALGELDPATRQQLELLGYIH